MMVRCVRPVDERVSISISRVGEIFSPYFILMEEIMSTIISRLFHPHHRPALQSYVLLGLGVIFLLAALLLRLNARAYPVGLLLFGLGVLVAAAVNRVRLVIAGLFYTFVGAAFVLGV